MVVSLCSGGKPPWECLKDHRISPVHRVQGCHSYKISLINWSRGSFSCQSLAGDHLIQPTGSLDFSQELWMQELRMQELQGLTARFPSATPAAGDNTYLWDFATVLDSQFYWIQNRAGTSYLQLFQLNSEQWCCLFPPTLSTEVIVLLRRKWPMSGELPQIGLFFFPQNLVIQKIHMWSSNWTEELHAL